MFQVISKDIPTCLLSVHNIISLSRHDKLTCSNSSLHFLIEC